MTVLAAIVAGLGALLTLAAAIGLVRLPDPISRLHAATKAGVLGVVLLLVSVVMALPAIEVAIRSLAAAFFLVITAPVAAHAIGRSAHRSGLTGDLAVDESPDRSGDGEGAPGPSGVGS